MEPTQLTGSAEAETPAPIGNSSSLSSEEALAATREVAVALGGEEDPGLKLAPYG
jgi:hypothetical protein